MASQTDASKSKRLEPSGILSARRSERKLLLFVESDHREKRFRREAREILVAKGGARSTQSKHIGIAGRAIGDRLCGAESQSYEFFNITIDIAAQGSRFPQFCGREDVSLPYNLPQKQRAGQSSSSVWGGALDFAPSKPVSANTARLQ